VTAAGVVAAGSWWGIRVGQPEAAFGGEVRSWVRREERVARVLVVERALARAVARGWGRVGGGSLRAFHHSVVAGSGWSWVRRCGVGGVLGMPSSLELFLLVLGVGLGRVGLTCLEWGCRDLRMRRAESLVKGPIWAASLIPCVVLTWTIRGSGPA